MVNTLSKVSIGDLPVMIQLMSTSHPDFENNSFNRIAKMLSIEFNVECTVFDVEAHYTNLMTEDFELINRKIEYDYEDTN